jgi:hypothetical protein
MLIAQLMISTAAMLVAQAPGTSAPAAPIAIPPRIEKFLQACETSRRGAIVQLEYELRGLRAGGDTSPKAAERIRKIEARLEALRANREPVVPALAFPPEIGAIGRLPRLTCHVDQVLGDEEMLVRAIFAIKVRTVRQFRARLETVERETPLLIRGVPTGKFTAGSDVQLLEVFEIVGRHTYTSVGGQSIAVLVLAPFDMSAIKPYFRAMSTAP